MSCGGREYRRAVINGYERNRDITNKKRRGEEQ
jgi:hypothetical protein